MEGLCSAGREYTKHPTFLASRHIGVRSDKPFRELIASIQFSPGPYDCSDLTLVVAAALLVVEGYDQWPDLRVYDRC